MGYTRYIQEDRAIRSTKFGYSTKNIDDIFTQNRMQMIHESMSPRGIDKRESMDSENHPNTIPIILVLDETGSMGKIPHMLIKDGLPKMMDKLISNGVEDPALLFLAIGDHTCDRAPIQVGQFESGDAELDLWLTRTWLEGKGGGNEGESYFLSWYFAAKHTKTDSFDKRGEKGFLITIGDEPCLKTLPKNAIEEIFGDVVEESYTDSDLLEMASEKWNIYHLHVLHGPRSEKALGYWKEILGDNCIAVKDHNTIPQEISDIIISNGFKPIKKDKNEIPSIDDFLMKPDDMML